MDDITAAQENPHERVRERWQDNPEPTKKTTSERCFGIANEHSPRKFPGKLPISYR
jgi:hypothetical protein